MTQRRSLNAFIDGNGFVVELAEDWNFLPCSTPAINELSPALLPGRHCQHCRDAQEVGDRRWTQTPQTTQTNTNKHHKQHWARKARLQHGQPSAGTAAEGIGAMSIFNGLVFPSPEQKKGDTSCYATFEPSQLYEAHFLPRNAALGLLLCSLGWGSALPCFSCFQHCWLHLLSGPFHKHSGAQQNLWAPTERLQPKLSVQRLSASDLTTSQTSEKLRLQGCGQEMWSQADLCHLQWLLALSPWAPHPCPCPRSELERSDSIFWVSSSAGGWV